MELFRRPSKDERGESFVSNTDKDFLHSKEAQYHAFLKITFWSTLACLAVTFLVVIPVISN